MSTNVEKPQNSLLVPVLSALVFALAGGLMWLGLEQLGGMLGAPSPQPATDGIFVTLLFLQSGYFVAVGPILRRSGQQCLESLSGHLNTTAPGLDDIRAHFDNTRRTGLYWAMLPALAIVLITQEGQFGRFSAWLSSPAPALGEFWTVMAAWTTWTMALWMITRVVRDVSAIRRLGRDCVIIDLMRIQPLVAFSRYGLQLAGLTVCLIAVWTIVGVALTSFLLPEGIETSRQIVLLMLIIYLTMTITAFIFPQLGIRENMRAQKDSAADRITAQLPMLRQGGVEDSVDAEQLAALLSVRSQVQTLPDWPIGQHTRVRLVFYLFIPLFSWTAAAVVEELLSPLWS